MPAVQGPAPQGGRGYANTTPKHSEEIENEIVSQIKHIGDVMRPKKDGLFETKSFHLDVVLLSASNQYKVEIQFDRKKGSGTVAVALVAPGATSLADLQTALRNSLAQGRPWIVT